MRCETLEVPELADASASHVVLEVSAGEDLLLLLSWTQVVVVSPSVRDEE